MLRDDVVELATRSLAAGLVERRTAFPRKLQAIQAQLAAKGIVGGPTLVLITDAGRTECEDRIDLAASELQRAATSKGLRYYPALAKDFGDALDQLSGTLCDDVGALGRTTLHILPSATGGVGMFLSTIQDATRRRVYKGRTNLEHYAESLHTKERERAREIRLKLWQLLLAAAVGAGLTLLVQWIEHRVGIG